MRELKTKDIFKMSKILKKTNLREEAKKLMVNIKEEDKLTDEQKDELMKEKGIEFVYSILENLHLAEKEINELLADLLGMELKEFEDLPPNESFKIIKDFMNQEGVQSFFKQAAGLMK